jgi:hypothetical protein
MRCVALVCVLSACAGLGKPPAAFVREVGRAGHVRVERHGDAVVAYAIDTTRAALPRAAAVTIAAVQPGGAHTRWETTWQRGKILYRATTRYAEPGVGTRSVLVDAEGAVHERTHEVAMAQLASGDLAAAHAACSKELAGAEARYEIVQGPDGEWLRAAADDGTRIVDCEFSGVLRSVRGLEARAR